MTTDGFSIRKTNNPNTADLYFDGVHVGSIEVKTHSDDFIECVARGVTIYKNNDGDVDRVATIASGGTEPYVIQPRPTRAVPYDGRNW